MARSLRPPWEWRRSDEGEVASSPAQSRTNASSNAEWGASPLRRTAVPRNYRGGTTKNNHFLGHFCTFWTRVAISAPRRPKRTKPGSKAVWVLGNQLVAGFARRFGGLARQHVRCGAHMCPFQGQKSALGARSYTRAQPRSTAYIRAQTML